MPKTWRIVTSDVARIAQLERAAGIPSVVAQLLLSRGIETPDDARRFLECKLTGLRDPEELPGIPAASQRITAAIAARERIVIYGDYDADGMTATAILYRCLRLLGADVGYYVPCRLEEGYGLSEQALAKLAADGAKLVVTVDCGIASLDEAEAARRLGLSLVITDHHQPGERLPDAEAIVHPRMPSRPGNRQDQSPGARYPFGDLCGSGVAFKLAWAICQQASRPGAGKTGRRVPAVA